jgi:hypothetical protein
VLPAGVTWWLLLTLVLRLLAQQAACAALHVPAKQVCARVSAQRGASSAAGVGAGQALIGAARGVSQHTGRCV